MALRSYAGFLFPQRRFDEAREIFRQAISLIQGDSDQIHYTNGFSYQMWAWNEFFNAESAELARQMFERAENEFRKIDNDKVGRDAIMGLYAAVPLPPTTRSVTVQG